MPIVEWSDSFLIGVEPFDEHHKHLVELLNRSYNEFVLGAPAEKAGAILDELFDYACYHFVAEEFWMSKSSYPKTKQHIEEHNYFTLRLQQISRDYRQGNTAISLEIMTFLKEWLINHILKSDADYGHFVTPRQKTSHPD